MKPAKIDAIVEVMFDMFSPEMSDVKPYKMLHPEMFQSTMTMLDAGRTGSFTLNGRKYDVFVVGADEGESAVFYVWTERHGKKNRGDKWVKVRMLNATSVKQAIAALVEAFDRDRVEWGSRGTVTSLFLARHMTPEQRRRHELLELIAGGRTIR